MVPWPGRGPRLVPSQSGLRPRPRSRGRSLLLLRAPRSSLAAESARGLVGSRVENVAVATVVLVVGGGERAGRGGEGAEENSSEGEGGLTSSYRRQILLSSVGGCKVCRLGSILSRTPTKHVKQGKGSDLPDATVHPQFPQEVAPRASCSHRTSVSA